MMALSDGRLYSWGKGIDGQLGIGRHTNTCFPTCVEPLSNDVEDMSCGSNHTLVKTTNGKCYAFGNGIYGQLGVGNNKNAYDPVLVKIPQVDEISAGENYSLFTLDGTVYGVGDNSFGQVDGSIKKKCIL